MKGGVLLRVLALWSIVACGAPQTKGDPNAAEVASERLHQAIDSLDVGRIKPLLSFGVSYRGLVFEDQGCTDNFGEHGRLVEYYISEFAKCLTTIAGLRQVRWLPQVSWVASFDGDPAVTTTTPTLQTWSISTGVIVRIEMRGEPQVAKTEPAPAVTASSTTR